MLFNFVRRSFARAGLRNKLVSSAYEAVHDIVPGSSVMIGGFGVCGVPENLIDAITQFDTHDLTVVTSNAGTTTFASGKLLQSGQTKKIICSYAGENNEFLKQFLSGSLEVQFTPQGTLAAKIRYGGAGIPAIYTPTGVGTWVQFGGIPQVNKKTGIVGQRSEPKEGKVFKWRGKERMYILEESITADFALIKAQKADTFGNCTFHATARNFNEIMGMAAKTTIVEAEEIVQPGQIPPNEVNLPGIHVNRLIQGKNYKKPIERPTFRKADGTFDIPEGRGGETRLRIAQRAAKEFQDGAYVNLGIGLPTLTVNYMDPKITIYLHGENGILGMGPYPFKGQEDPDLISAGKETITYAQGASVFNSAVSFDIIRGAHLDLTMLGGMQVSEKGDLSNWIIPGKMMNGMGGAMDLVSSGSKVVVLMEHISKKGEKRILKTCTFPRTGRQVVDLLITEMGVFKIDKTEGITMTEIAKEHTVEEVKAATGCDLKIAPDLKIMNP